MKEIVFALTYLEILYITLSFCAIFISIFLIVLIKRLITFLWYINTISEKVSNLTELLNTFLIKPIQFLELFIDYIWKMIDGKK